MSRKQRVILLAGLIVVVSAIGGYYYYKSRRDVVEVQTDRVLRVEELVARVNASGEIKPKEYVELQAEITGVITHLMVEEGDFVTKDDVLLKIDPTQTHAETRAQEALLQAAMMESANSLAQITLQQASLGRERANVHAAEADVLKAQQAVELSTNNFNRLQELFEQNLISRDQYEIAKNELVAAQAGRTSSQARLEQAKASLAVAEIVLEQARNSRSGAESRVDQNRAALTRARDSYSKTIIRSPLTGVITQLNVEAGERAVPGTLNNPAATIMVIADLSVIEAEIEVNETDIVAVKLNQPALVKVDALPLTPLVGVVSEIGNSAITTLTSQEAKEFKVAIRLTEPPEALRPGLSCTADITTATRSDVLTIPIQALVIREYPADEAGRPIKVEDGLSIDSDSLQEFEGVFAVRQDRAEFVPVKVGISGRTIMEIESGLEEGVEIVSGSYKALRDLKDDDPIQVKEDSDEG